MPLLSSSCTITISQSISKSHLFYPRSCNIPTSTICKNITTTNVPKPFYLCSLLLVPNYNKTKNSNSFYKITNPRVFCNKDRRIIGLCSMSSLTDDHHSVPYNKTVRVVVKGRVQGVFYRNWTIENANELGLRGWVRNRRDGSVEALFSGSSDKVQEMEQRCRRGPPAAMVTNIEVSPCNDDPGTGFERKQTV